MYYSTIFFTGLLYAVRGQIDATCTQNTDCDALTTTYSPYLQGKSFICSPNTNAGLCTIECTQDADCAIVAGALGLTLTCNTYGSQMVCDTDTSCSTTDDCTANGLAALGLSACTNGYCVTPTPAPTTASSGTVPTAPTAQTPEPTPAPTYDCNTCATYEADPYRCSTASNDLVYSFFPLDCTDADNECDAKCSFADTYEAQKATLSTANQAALESYVTSQGGVDGLFLQYCEAGTCSTTSESPTSTEDDSCTCDNDCWHATGCSDDDGSGCSILLDATLDFCLIDRRWGLGDVWSNMRSTYVSTLAALVPSKSSFCSDAELKIEEWTVEYLTSSAMTRADERPANAAECNAINLDTICGGRRDSPQFRISMKVGFFCGSCSDTQTVLLTLLDVLNTDKQCNERGTGECEDEFGGQVVSNCMTKSSEDDPVCAGTDVAGFGGVAFEVQEATIAYRDESGAIVGDVTSLKSGGSRVVYGVAVIVAAMSVFLR